MWRQPAICSAKTITMFTINDCLFAGCVDTTAVKTRLYENTTVPMIIKTAPTALSKLLQGLKQIQGFVYVGVWVD